MGLSTMVGVLVVCQQELDDMVLQLLCVGFSLFQDFIVFQHHARSVLLLLALFVLFCFLLLIQVRKEMEMCCN